MKKSVKDIDFQYYIDLDTHVHCREEVDELDYQEIVSVDIIDINSVNLAICIAKKLKVKDRIKCYAIERFCSFLTAADFEVSWEPYYYGDIIKEVCLVTENAISFIDELVGLSAHLAVGEVLIEEYGYLIEVLKNAKFDIVKVAIKDIVFPNKEYYSKLDRKYKNTILQHIKLGPIAICKQIDTSNGKKFEVIDGYHRVRQAQLSNKRKVEILVIRKEHKK